MPRLKFVFLFLILFSSFSFVGTDSRLTGKWTGDSEGDVGTIIFTEDGFATMKFENEVIGGKSFMIDDVEMQMKYVADVSKKPMEIDFIISETESGVETQRLRGIMEFLNENKQLNLCLGFEGGRPDKLIGDYCILLEKEK